MTDEQIETSIREVFRRGRGQGVTDAQTYLRQLARIVPPPWDASMIETIIEGLDKLR